MLWKELHTKYGFAFLRTRNLSQDWLENFFSIIRWKNSNNNHPDPSKFSSAYKSIVVNQLIAPKKLGNVEADLSKYFVSTPEMADIKLISTPKPKLKTTKANFKDEDIDLNQANSIFYTTGWIGSKILHKDCLERCYSDVDHVGSGLKILLNNKKYKDTSRLCVPGLKLYKFCKKIVFIFEKNFEKFLKQSTHAVKKKLLDVLFWPYKSDKSEEHIVYDILCIPCAKMIANKYINMLIKAKLQVLNTNMKAADRKKRANKKSKVTAKRRKLNING